MARARYEHRHLDVLCELDADGLGARGEEWRSFREANVRETEGIPGGVRLWLAPQAWVAADDLARREAACCGFLDFDLVEGREGLRLDITSPVGDAGAVIELLAGMRSADS